MLAPGAWGDAGAAPAAGTALMTSGGNPGQYASHPGGATARHSIAPMNTGAGPIVWEFDFLDSGIGNRRVTGGLRVDNSVTILEMGVYNSSLNPETGVTGAGYSVRANNIGAMAGGVAGSWFLFPGNPALRAGWHHFRATMTPTSILFELDFSGDGTVDATRLLTTNDTSAIGWNVLRFGGPSDLSSTPGGAGYDNYSISQIPEPSALALLALGGLLARRR
jgi:hypothetical protein